MKKLTLFVAVAIGALFFASCNKVDYKSFVGTWGVEKIEYYNIDYAGHPIAASLETYTYDPEDLDNGIQLIFREDKTGEMRDSNIDTVWTDYNEQTHTYESFIYNPDTTLVYPFTYLYDKSESILTMKITYSYPYERTEIFLMRVSNMTKDSFIYENEYDVDYMERAYLTRLSNTPSKVASRQMTAHPHKPGSFLGGR